MRNPVVLFSAIVFFVAGTTAVAEPKAFTVKAAGFDDYEGDLLEVGYPDPRRDGGFEVLDLAFVENGHATVVVEPAEPFSEPLGVTFRLLAGERSGLFGQGIVEPGATIEVRPAADGETLSVAGGTYNALVFPHSLRAESPVETRDRLRDIYLNGAEAHARMLALQAAWLDGEDEDQARVLAELRNELGDTLAIQLMDARAAERKKEIARAMKDFLAKTLDGEEIRLTDVLQQNRYTLVEFWASWCGPCIAEIPYLKAAYDKYRDQGFEIVAVNLDTDREEWRFASEDEYDINWINVSDEQAFNSPIARLYRVKGIPSNYLVAPDGKRVASHLRGDELDRKLSSLFAD